MTPDSVTEQDSLLERIAQGDRSAVALCIERYSGLVWSLARRFIANEADAEEVVQDIFMELWAKAGNYDAKIAAEVTFISMLARRRLIDRLRKLNREPAREPLLEQHLEPVPEILDALETSSETRQVLKILNSIQPEQRQIIHMATWMGMSHGAIAAQVGLPLGTVKSHLRRGLLKIRDRLGTLTPAEEGIGS